jgi:hypothetical protein
MRLRVFFGEIPQQCKSKRGFATSEPLLFRRDKPKDNVALKLLMMMPADRSQDHDKTGTRQRLQTFDQPEIIQLWESYLSKFQGGISIKVYCMDF